MTGGAEMGYGTTAMQTFSTGAEMPIEVTSRHVSATPPMQQYARDKAEKLMDEFPRVEHVHVVLDAEKRGRIAEFVVQARNRIRVEARETTENMQRSIDRAAEKAEKQLRRLRDKVQEHRPAGPAPAAAAGAEEDG